jgi:hypothetical protein
VKTVHNSDAIPVELIFTSEDEVEARAIRRLAQGGGLRRIYAGVYTATVGSPLASVVARNWAAIVSHLLPGALLAYRSALEHRPVDGVLHVRRGKRRRRVEMPGLTVEVYPGEIGPLQEPSIVADVPYRRIYLPGEARGLVENMTGGRGASARVLPQEEIESRLDKILTLRGEHKLNNLRDQIHIVAAKLDREKEGKRLDAIIGALLGSHEKKRLVSKQALARASGKPFDPERIDLFDALVASLKDEVFPHPADPAESGAPLEYFAFFEAYFSNFIEGTTFQVEEAERIIFQGAIVENRPEDSHDILGTFHAATQSPWRDQPAATADDFLAWLKSINAIVMQARPDKTPGEWKKRANMAGNTLFVHPQHVPATLTEGFERIRMLHDPVARALMAMFVISEVHPFQDGNGRTARLAMNAVLSQAGLCRIIIPTIYREDYLLPLKRLSNQRDATAFIKAMTRIHDWTSRFDYGRPLAEIQAQLARCHAFQDDLRNYRIIFPEA